MPEQVDEIIRKFDRKQAKRASWDPHWQELKDFVRPDAKDFNFTSTSGDKKTLKIFDGTAPRAARELTGGIQSYMTSQTERWFEYTAEDPRDLEDHDAKLWLEVVSDTVYHLYQMPSSSLNPMLHEDYLDMTVFGTSVINQEPNKDFNGLVFRTQALADCYIDENSSGQIDSLDRRVIFTTRQVKQEFKKVPKKVADCADSDKEWKFLHAVSQRDERNRAMYDGYNKVFYSCWVCLDDKQSGVIDEKGYDEFPYHVGRWSRTAGEIYGRSPAMECLPDILMVNEMSKTILKAAQKITDPPLMVPDDGFMMPLDTTPSGLNFYEAGSQDRLIPLETKGRPEIGLEIQNQRREHIQKCFFVDWLAMQKNNVEMTAYEVADRREEQFRMMSPQLGRIATEKLNPMLRRSYNLAKWMGLIPPPPPALRGKKIRVTYTSPAARAQTASKSLTIDRFIANMAPLFQIRMDAMDYVDTDAITKLKMLTMGLPPSVQRTDAMVVDIRKRRSQQEQMQLMAGAGTQVSSIAKDLTQAQLNTAKARAA